MRRYHAIRFLLIACWIISSVSVGRAAGSSSVYTQKPDDPEAFYFTPENYAFKADGKSDVTEAIQEAINQVKREKNFGILFLPDVKYRISRDILFVTTARSVYGIKIR